MKVICISGKARHGKDTLAGILKTHLEDQGNKVLIAHFGDLVKYICEKFFDWNGQKDEEGRTLLQYVSVRGCNTHKSCDNLTFFIAFRNIFQAAHFINLRKSTPSYGHLV